MPTTEAHEVTLSADGLTADEVIGVARADARVSITDEATAAMQRAADIVAALDHVEEPVYGVSTGFGSLARVRVPAERRAELQKALVRSHASGMGPPIEREVVRAMMLLRARTLAMGWSGTRPIVAETIAELLNAGITPIVPEYGSLGASGDLAPLAHCALALIGEGEVEVQVQVQAQVQVQVNVGREPATRMAAADALAAAQITPLELGAKEGLALINGTDGMLGMLVLACADLGHLLRVADITAAMSVEALLGTDRAFAPDLVGLRPQLGQAASAENLFTLLAGSEIVASHRHGDPRVQDAYSLRCAPQVNGAARDTLAHARTTAEHELRAAIDNPMVLPDGRVESCGNFHGAPLAFACDFLAVAIAAVGSIAERRTDRLLDASRSQGLPAFLAEDAGVNSGLMLSHYAQAALVAESRRLATPASVDSIPTSAMQEDHVSMGWGAARKLRTAVDNLRRILAVELVTAARGLDLRAPLVPAPGTKAALAVTRERVAGPGPDRFLAPELAAAEELIGSGALLDAVHAQIGALR
jgi:histidine ammonia-lyase